MVQVVGIAGFTRRHVRQLRRDRLSHDDGAGFPQQAYARCILFRLTAAIDRRAILSWHVGGRDDVLDRDRQAVQRARLTALCQLRVGRLGLCTGIVRIKVFPRLDIGFPGLDASDAGLDEVGAR